MVNDEYIKKLDKHFADFEPETDVIVVGTSPTLKYYEFGKYIDKFKTVVRVNKCFSDEMWQHTGKKVDIWSTTHNFRWEHFHPTSPDKITIWPRKEKVGAGLKKNGTIEKMGDVEIGKATWELLKEKNVRYGSSKTFPGVGTGLITLERCVREFDKITIIGHTFYLEGGTDERALNFYSEEEDEEHKKNRDDYFKGDWHRLKQMAYVDKWLENGNVVLLNPYEYDNIRRG